MLVFSSFKNCTHTLILLFIILSAVCAHAQTPLRPVFPTRQPEVSKDSHPENSDEQTEVSDDSPPAHYDEQVEESEDSIPEGSVEQIESGDYSPPEDYNELIELSEDSPPVESTEQTELRLPDHTEMVTRDYPPMHSTVKPDFFFAPLAEVIGYGLKNPSLGAGFALGAGNGVAIGLCFLYTIDSESLHTIELTVFLRFYLRGPEACTGPFIQLITGAALHTHKHGAFAFAGSGALSAGIAVGWRFPLGKRWYIESSVRAGYPYIAGVGVSFALKL